VAIATFIEDIRLMGEGGFPMLFRRLFLWIYAFSLLTITGCSIDETNDQQTLALRRLGEDHSYQDFREITNQEKVHKVRSVLKEASWEQAKVEMERPADYRFVFEYRNSHIEAKPVLYEIWISPNEKQVELVKGEFEYVHLNEKESTIFLEVTRVDE
jgi:hypothetical protein